MSFYILLINVAIAGPHLQSAITKPIPISQITNFSNYPVVVRQLITTANVLTQKKLTYLYGSSDPQNGGMDCSGTIYYLLSSAKLNDVPRQANEMFTWVNTNGKFYYVTSHDIHSLEFSKLKPGDLLFWSGTYHVNRKPSVTHVMLYLGKDINNNPLMFGSSDGRTYQGKKMWGVSVFDFKLPTEYDSAKFIGYGCIPNLTCN